MTSKSPGYISEPNIQFLSQVLDEMARGQLLVPRFQRPQVWTLEQRLELLRSVRAGIPVGSIMVWRTSHKGLHSFRELGPHELGAEIGDEALSSYLLDGFQRLSTLFIAIYPRSGKVLPEAGDVDDESSRDYFYDLRRRDFLVRGRRSPQAHWLPLHIALDSVALLKYQRSLFDLEDGDQLVEAADDLAKAFRDYKLPVIPIATNDLTQATLTFQRINSQGTAMSEVHMVNALTWSTAFDLQDSLDDLREELASVGWGDLDDKLVLATCKACADLDVYGVAADDVSRAIREDPSILRRAVHHLRRAAQFLGRECGISRPRLLPYSLQVVLLADAFREAGDRELDAETSRLVADWVWLSTYWAIFPGLSGPKLRRTFEDLKCVVRGEPRTWAPRRSPKLEGLPRRYDFRSGRAKAMAFRLAELRPHSSEGKSTDGLALLRDHDAGAMQHIIPRGAVSPALFAGPANRMLAAPDDAGALRDRLLGAYANEEEEFLKSHVVERESAAALQAGDYERFLRFRLRDLNALDQEFVRLRENSYFSEQGD